MNINADTINSVSKTNQDGSRITRFIEQCDAAITSANDTKHNPTDEMQVASDEDILASSKKLIHRNRIVYEELAK